MTKNKFSVPGFMQALRSEYKRATRKFPEPNPNLIALMEEVGELARAILEDKNEEDIFMEAVQVATCAMRCAIHKDPQWTRTKLRGGKYANKK